MSRGNTKYCGLFKHETQHIQQIVTKLWHCGIVKGNLPDVFRQFYLQNKKLRGYSEYRLSRLSNTLNGYSSSPDSYLKQQSRSAFSGFPNDWLSPTNKRLSTYGVSTLGFTPNSLVQPQSLTKCLYSQGTSAPHILNIIMYLLLCFQDEKITSYSKFI